MVTRPAAPLPAIPARSAACRPSSFIRAFRSEEHTSELQSPCNIVCRLLLEKKKYQMDIKLRRFASLLGGQLRGSNVLVTCCGSGMDAEYLASCGARVVSLDISSGCISRATT